MFDDADVRLLDLAPTESDKKIYDDNPIMLRKYKSKINSLARKSAKLKNCLYCNTSVDGMCNSHTIPKFCLKNIAVDGKVLGFQNVLKTPGDNDDIGLNEACTFHVLCRKCDSTIFQLYENPETYSKAPDCRVLAQIAAKNHLLEISKCLESIQIFDPNNPIIDSENYWFEVFYDMAKADLNDHMRDFEIAKSILTNDTDDKYNLILYKKLDFVVPVAAQCCFAMICGFDTTVVNNVYDFHPHNSMQFLHIAIFPLKAQSIVLAFTLCRNYKYRKFIRSFRLMQESDQLSVINYLVFLYTENFLLSKKIPLSIIEDKEFVKICARSGVAISNVPDFNSLKASLEYFNLSNHLSIQNLLALKIETNQ